MRAQVAKDLRIERLKQVREQSRRQAATQSREYRGHIDCMKDNKRAELMFAKQTESMEKRRQLQESYKYSLVETGAAHRLAETARKKTSAEGRVQRRKMERQREVSEHRFEQAISVRRTELSQEERRLEMLRENLRNRHDIGAHHREEASTLAAMRQARADQRRRLKRSEGNADYGVTINTAVALQTDVDITRRCKVVKVDARVVRHGAVATVRNEAVVVKIDAIHELRAAVVREMKVRWKQEQRVEVAREKRVEKKRRDTFALSLAALDRLDRSPVRKNRIRNIADVRKIDRRTLEITDRDLILSQFENMFFNPHQATEVEAEIAADTMRSPTRARRDDTSEESSAHSSPDTSFKGRVRSPGQSRLADRADGGSSRSSVEGPEADSSVASAHSDQLEDETFDGFRCQRFSVGDLYAAGSPSAGLETAADADTDIDDAALEQSMYSQNASQLPYVDETDHCGSEQDNYDARNDPEVNTWIRVHRPPSRRSRTAGAGPSQGDHSHSTTTVANASPVPVVSSGETAWEVPAWTKSDSVFVIKLPAGAGPEDIVDDDAGVTAQFEDDHAGRSESSGEYAIDGCAEDRQSDCLEVSNKRSVNQSHESHYSGIGCEDNDNTNYQLFFENEDYAEMDLSSKLVTSPDVKPPPPPSIDDYTAQHWLDAVSASNDREDPDNTCNNQFERKAETHSVLSTAGSIGVLVRAHRGSNASTPHTADDGSANADTQPTVLIADVNIPHPSFPYDSAPVDSPTSDVEGSSPSSSSLESGGRLELDINRVFAADFPTEDATAVFGAVIPSADSSDEGPVVPPADSSDDSMKVDPELYEQYMRSPLVSARKPAGSAKKQPLPPLTLSITPDTSQDNLSYSVTHGVDDSWKEEQNQAGKSICASDIHDSSAGNMSIASTVAARHDLIARELSPLTADISRAGELSARSQCLDSDSESNPANILSPGSRSASVGELSPLFSALSQNINSEKKIVGSDMNDSISSSSSDNDEDSLLAGDLEIDRNETSYHSVGSDALVTMNDSVSSSSSESQINSLASGDLEVDRKENSSEPIVGADSEVIINDMNDSISSSSSDIDEDSLASGDLEVDRKERSFQWDSRNAPFPSPSFAREVQKPNHMSPDVVVADVDCDDDNSSQSSLSWSADQSRSFVMRPNTTTVLRNTEAVAVAPLVQQEKLAEMVAQAVAPDIESVHSEQVGKAESLVNDEMEREEESGLDILLQQSDTSHSSNGVKVSAAKLVVRKNIVEVLDPPSSLFDDASSVDDSSDDESMGLDDLNKYNINLDDSDVNFSGRSDTVAAEIDDVDAKFDALLAYAATSSRSSKVSSGSSSGVSLASDSSVSLEIKVSGGVMERMKINQDKFRRMQQTKDFSSSMGSANALSALNMTNDVADAGSVASDSLNQSLRSSPSLSVELASPVMRSTQGNQARSEAGHAIATTYIRHISSSEKSSHKTASLLKEPILSEDSLNADDSRDSLVPKRRAASSEKNRVVPHPPEGKKPSASISSRYQQFQINQYKHVSAPTRTSQRSIPAKAAALLTSTTRSASAANVSNVRTTRGATAATVTEPLDLSDMPVLQEFEYRLRKIESELSHYDVLSTSLNPDGDDSNSIPSTRRGGTGLDDSMSLHSAELDNLVYREQRLSETPSKRASVAPVGDISAASVTSSDLNFGSRGGLDNPSSTESESLMYLYYHTTGETKNPRRDIDDDATLDEIKNILEKSNVDTSYTSLVDREVAAALKELEDSDSDSDQDLSLSINSIVGDVERRAESRVSAARNLIARSTAESGSPQSYSTSQLVSSKSAHEVPARTTGRGEIRQVVSTSGYMSSSITSRVTSDSTPVVSSASSQRRSRADLTAYSLDAFMGYTKSE